MNIFIVILIILICVVLSFFVLIQNPKGGGLSGTFGGYGSTVMGAKQSSDAVEKGTWYTALILGVVVLLSFVLAPKVNDGSSSGSKRKIKTPTQQSAPALPAPVQGGASGPAPAPAPTGSAPAGTPTPTK